VANRFILIFRNTLVRTVFYSYPITRSGAGVIVAVNVVSGKMRVERLPFWWVESVVLRQVVSQIHT
jgi:hypothetical protein